MLEFSTINKEQFQVKLVCKNWQLNLISSSSNNESFSLYFKLKVYSFFMAPYVWETKPRAVFEGNFSEFFPYTSNLYSPGSENIERKWRMEKKTPVFPRIKTTLLVISIRHFLLVQFETLIISVSHSGFLHLKSHIVTN